MCIAHTSAYAGWRTENTPPEASECAIWRTSGACRLYSIPGVDARRIWLPRRSTTYMDLNGSRGNPLTEEKENTVAGRLKGRLSLPVLAFAVVVVLAFSATAFGQVAGDPSGSTASPAPTIQSDKPDYAPGELVTLTGSNWQPGESVNI